MTSRRRTDTASPESLRGGLTRVRTFSGALEPGERRWHDRRWRLSCTRVLPRGRWTMENRVLMKRAPIGRSSRPPQPTAKVGDLTIDFPLQESVGYQIRATHRLLQRYLQMKIEPYDVTLGMWYFLRALWNEDGLTQRELSNRIGTMEPTTLSAIQIMERRGLVTRVRRKQTGGKSTSASRRRRGN